MGYNIQYENSVIKTITKEQKAAAHRQPFIKWIAVACAFLLLVFLVSGGYLDFLIPGDKDVTAAAFKTMVNDVASGENLKAAITAFCMEIIDGAAIAG